MIHKLQFILYIEIAPGETISFNRSNCVENENKLCEDDNMMNSTKFHLAPMGVQAPGSAHA